MYNIRPIPEISCSINHIYIEIISTTFRGIYSVHI